MINVIIAAVIIAPAALLIFFRSNAALTFLTLCLGSLLAQVAANDTSQVVGSFVPHGNAASLNTIPLALLFLPPVLTAIFMIKSVKRNAVLLQVLPAVGVGAAALLLARPYLPATLARRLQQSSLWPQISELQVIIIGASAFICLLVIWIQRPKHAGKHGEEGH